MILIIGAMPQEVSALRKRMSNEKEYKIDDILVYEGLIANQKTLIALSGIGKVNAAITATTLVKSLPITSIINIGSAGGLHPEQKIGDVIVASKSQYHDFDIGDNTNIDERFIFYPSQKYHNTVLEILDKEQIRYHSGLLVAGDQFIKKDSNPFKNIQRMFPKAIAVDMESTAIAAVAQQFKIPFVVLRSLSDVTQEADNDLSFEKYLDIASEQSANICELFIKKEFK